MGRKSRVGVRFKAKDAVPFRVTLWLTQEERAQIQEIAKKELPLTWRRQPRNGILVTELVRFAMEEIEKRKAAM